MCCVIFETKRITNEAKKYHSANIGCRLFNDIRNK